MKDCNSERCNCVVFYCAPFYDDRSLLAALLKVITKFCFQSCGHFSNFCSNPLCIYKSLDKQYYYEIIQHTHKNANIQHNKPAEVIRGVYSI